MQDVPKEFPRRGTAAGVSRLMRTNFTQKYSPRRAPAAHYTTVRIGLGVHLLWSERSRAMPRLFSEQSGARPLLHRPSFGRARPAWVLVLKYSEARREGSCLRPERSKFALPFLSSRGGEERIVPCSHKAASSSTLT